MEVQSIQMILNKNTNDNLILTNYQLCPFLGRTNYQRIIKGKTNINFRFCVYAFQILLELPIGKPMLLTNYQPYTNRKFSGFSWKNKRNVHLSKLICSCPVWAAVGQLWAGRLPMRKASETFKFGRFEVIWAALNRRWAVWAARAGQPFQRAGQLGSYSRGQGSLGSYSRGQDSPGSRQGF